MSLRPTTIGLDMDGVCADFNAAYVDGLCQLTGIDRFHPEDRVHPPVWDYPEHRGYTSREVSEFWHRVNADPNFWRSLQPLPEFTAALPRLRAALDAGHRLAVITNRRGRSAATQTLDWLTDQGLSEAMVASTADKASWVVRLAVDTFLDDKWENAVDIDTVLPHTSYLLSRAYNVGPVGAPPLRRVSSLHEYLDRINL